MGTHLPKEDYRRVVESIPIVCVDLLIRRDGKYLLLKRTREPLKGDWWVPGGRMFKGETALWAARRKAWDECRLVLVRLRFRGYFEDQYPVSHIGPPIHSVSLVFEATGIGKVKLNYESEDFQWSAEIPQMFVRGWKTT